MLRKLLLALALCAFLPGLAHADAEVEAKMTKEQFLAKMNFQEGKINLGGGVATLDLPATFRYLSPADTERLLVDGWGNMPGNTTLGMIVPAGVSPLSDAGWGVIVTFDKDGHVKDDDADSIKYDELLKTMQEESVASNAERKKAGYGSMTLVGWAEKPSYDKASHKLFWAKELKTGDDPQNSLNYNIRVLGREGVLVLNAVAGMNQIDTIRKEMKHVTAFTEFTPGNRYADFNEKTDRVAEYGIAALVAGGVAAKLGLFAKLFAFLLLFKKFVIIGVVAIGAAFVKWFGARKQKVNLDK
ncbi:MAG: DUF2167 domain-containing protein [Pseudomonadota bacterium]